MVEDSNRHWKGLKRTLLVNILSFDFIGQSDTFQSVSSGVFIGTTLTSANETSLQFTTNIGNDNWLGALYHNNIICRDINGNNLLNNECEITTPKTWTPQPVDLVLASLSPGKQYNITLEETKFRNNTDVSTEGSTNPVSAVFCPSN